MNLVLTHSVLKEIDRLNREEAMTHAELAARYGVTAGGITRALKRFRGERRAPQNNTRQAAQIRAGRSRHEAEQKAREKLATRAAFMRHRLAKLREKQGVAA